MKYILKLFLPSEDKLSKILANKIAECINNSGKSDVIAKYGTIADEVSKIQQKVTSVISDGKISDDETDEVADLILPVIKRVYKEVL